MSLTNRHNVPGLQDAPHSGDLQQSQWMQQITQLVRQGTGQHGSQDQKWLTLKDLENLHVVEQLPGGGYTPGGGGGTGPSEPPPDTSPPEPLKNLEARGGMTAIRVLWDAIEHSYYYRVEVHKSATDDLGEAFLVGTTQGNIYQDVVGSDETTWYYWARVVKQVGDITIIGPWNQTQGTPAAAAPDPDWILKDLEGKIGDWHLNDNLNREIDKIPEIERDVGDIEDSIKDIENDVGSIEDNIKDIDVDMDGIRDSIKDIEIDISELETGLHTETEERQTEDESLHKRIDTNVSRIGDNAAAIVTESETRATEDEALARQITTLAAEVEDNAAAIQTESEVRATEDEALASQITTLKAEVDGNTAAIQTESEVRATEDEALAKRIDTNVSSIGDNTAAIVTESETRATEDEALSKRIDLMAVEVGDNTAAIQTESEIRATEDEALASRITTMQAEVDGNKAAIQSESEVRASEDEVLAKRIDTQTARIDDNAAAIQTESEVRATEDEALAKQITTLAAEVGDNTAAIETESEVRATEDEALAKRIDTMQVEVDGNKAAIQSESEVRATEDEALSKRIDTQTARVDENAAAIQTESETRATEDEALAKQITTLAAEVGENSAAIQEESNVRASEDEVLAERITTLRADMDDNSAAIRDEMTVIIEEGQKLASRVQTVELDLEETKGAIETRMTAVENEIGEIRLEYTVIVDNDGYAGGFSIINEDGVIAALWRVDVFAVGAPGCESLAFAIDAEENRVVMDGALIKNASITTAQIGELDVDRLVGGTADFVEANIRDGSIANAKIGNVIYSEGYQAGKKGWMLNKGGFAEFRDGMFRGLVESSIVRSSVIEGGLLIDSGSDIVKPTEADLGAGAVRHLCFYSKSYGIQGDDIITANICSANYTADGQEEYGDGQAVETVWKNFDRYISYNIKPLIIVSVGVPYSIDRGSCSTPSSSCRVNQGGDYTFKVEVVAVSKSGSETILKTFNLNTGSSGTPDYSVERNTTTFNYTCTYRPGSGACTTMTKSGSAVNSATFTIHSIYTFNKPDSDRIRIRVSDYHRFATTSIEDANVNYV